MYAPWTDSKMRESTSSSMSSICLMHRDCGALQVMMVSPVYQVNLVNQALQDIPHTPE